MLYNIYVGSIYGDILMRKKLALLTSQLEDDYQKDFITGFLEQAFDNDYDVCIFSCFQKEPETRACDGIYRLDSHCQLSFWRTDVQPYGTGKQYHVCTICAVAFVYAGVLHDALLHLSDDVFD
jgi:hypothetical protein